MSKPDIKNNTPFPDLIARLPHFSGHFNAFELAASNCKVLFAYYTKGQVIPSHTHESENVGVVIGGELILEKDSVEDRYPIGSWYHLGPNQVHAARFERNTVIIEFWFDSDEKDRG